MTEDFKGSVVVVTGASAGLGRAIARAFARRGAWLGLLARGKVGLAAVREEAERAGVRALTIPTDVADAKAVEAAAEEIERELGPISVWVNNAMTSVFAPFKDLTPDEFRRVTEVTYLGTVYGTMSALKRMLPRDRGVVVQVGSALAERSIPLQSAYCGAKHGIRGFTDSIRTELIHDDSKVHITMVQMPALNTPQFDWVKSKLPRGAKPVPPIYQPEEAAEAVVWAASHRRRELYVGMSTVGVMWGNKVAASLGDLYLGKTGYQAQQTDQPEDPGRPDNLWQPVEVDHGSRGRFDREAKRRIPQQFLARHRLGLGLAAGAAGALIWARRTRRG